MFPLKFKPTLDIVGYVGSVPENVNNHSLAKSTAAPRSPSTPPSSLQDVVEKIEGSHEYDHRYSRYGDSHQQFAGCYI